jgi:DNA-binding response OmpR family regulator
MTKIRKILLIEDDQFISDLYIRSLRKAGFEVRHEVTGPGGLAQAKTGEYDLVMLDIMLPDMTGIDVLNELRGTDNSALPNTKIIITTNLDQDDESRQDLEARADGYLIKADVTPRKLVEIIGQIEQFGEFKEPEE